MRLSKFSMVFENVFSIQIKLHWSILPSMVIFSGINFDPVFYLAFFVLIFIHEIGHALVVKLLSFRNHELIIHGLGGSCVWSGDATQKQQSIIAWGGILAQLFIFAAFILLTESFELPPNRFVEPIFRAFIGTNLFIMLFNLIPVAPFDGAEAWKIFSPIYDDLKSIRNKRIYKKSDKIVEDQIIQIFKENEGSPNKSVKRTRFPRR
jgi:Zn-dependent protease